MRHSFKKIVPFVEINKQQPYETKKLLSDLTVYFIYSDC